MSSSHIEALKNLRSMAVAIRRQRVADCLRFEWACGNERRLIEIQDAIAAIDAAIVDEYHLLKTPEQIALANGGAETPETIEPTGGNGSLPAHLFDRHPQAMNGNGSTKATSSNGWRSYQDWLRSSEAEGHAATGWR